MKKLIRRLSRVADSSQYNLLKCSSPSSARQADKTMSAVARRSKGLGSVPQGHVPVYVGEEMERFVVSAEIMNHPVFIELLKISAQEYGYQQKGVLRIPCHVLVFERVMESLRLGIVSRDLDDIFADEYF